MKHSFETRGKMSKTHIGKKHSAKSRKKISDSLTAYLRQNPRPKEKKEKNDRDHKGTIQHRHHRRIKQRQWFSLFGQAWDIRIHND
jgi:NUMOD3 motif